jgi:hypothetical protein
MEVVRATVIKMLLNILLNRAFDLTVGRDHLEYMNIYAS